MRLKGFTIFFFLLVICGQSQSQDWPSDYWHEGKVVLTSGDTLKGLIKYDLQQDLVQYDLEGVRKDAFSARKILMFEIFDNTVHLYRKFFSLPYNATAGYKTTMFFELMAEGKMTLLCREALENRTYSSPYYIGSYSRIVLVYKYFLLKENGDLVEFTGNKNDMLKLMGKHADDVEQYARTNKLKFDDKLDLMQIVKYYNSLF